MVLRVGVVGAGEIADVGHLPVYDGHSGIEIAAVADLDADRRDEAAESYDILRVFPTATEMFEATDLDAVSICTPPSTHADIFVRAAERGINVFCEKPFAASVDDAEQMAEAAQGDNVEVSIGYASRHLNNYRKVVTYVRRDLLGEVLDTQVICIVPPPTTSWRYNRDVAGGGIVADMAGHWMDFYMEMFGTTPVVRNATVRAVDTSDIEDYARFTLSFDGTPVTLLFRWAKSGATSESVRQNRLIAVDGDIEFNRTHLVGNVQGSGVRFKHGQPPQVSLGPLFNLWGTVDEQSHRKAVRSFVDYLLGEPNGEVTGVERGLELTRLRADIYDRGVGQ